MIMVCSTIEEAQILESRAFEKFCVDVPDNNAARWAEIEEREDGKVQFYVDERVTGAFTSEELENVLEG